MGYGGASTTFVHLYRPSTCLSWISNSLTLPDWEFLVNTVDLMFKELSKYGMSRSEHGIRCQTSA